ncbi:uncharacterized protein BX664DRAFT_325669 [Halteromyces radiatus]|uniref:uncharacterized protein n=1 Tax=Halteromyces radiatus TaxID=101107 RepID=UPI00221F0156|nr:uncharacterized protein BX664DRAFT_325669 [Halteromyces radiatus]KAI8097153.1 hypothetical protein BX664DRAFT_325669 [Halteromyces radiatus]
MGKKHTAQTLLDVDDFEIQEHQKYARSLGPRGNHQHEVEFLDGSKKLVTMPPRFRNLVWVKRGHFVVVDPSLGTVSEKVGGEIVQVLFPKHIKSLQQAGKWPTAFSQNTSNDQDKNEEQGLDRNNYSDDDEDDDLFVNNNRPVMSESESSSDEE